MIFSRLVVVTLLVSGILSLASCGSDGNTTVVSNGSGVGDSSTANVNLVWPEGYEYDHATHALHGVAGQSGFSVPSYVTKVTITITGDGMDPMLLSVPLDTMSVEFAVSPGDRTFTIVVETDIGLTFTDSVTLYLSAGGIGDLNFSLEINAPPTINSLTVSNATPAKAETVTVTASVSDPDPDDTITYSWNGGGGNISGSGASVGFYSSTGGVKTVTLTANDGHGGVTTGSVTVTIANLAPVITSVSVSNQTPAKGDVVTASCSAYDPDGDAISYSWSDGLGFTGSGSSISYMTTTTGEITLTCAVDDGDGGHTSAGVSLNGSGSATSPPTDVSATAGNNKITVTWGAVTGATSYNIYWNNTGSASTSDNKISGVSSPYDHTGLINGKTYYYVVTSVNGGSESSLSSEVSATPQSVTLTPPATITVSPDDGQTTITFTAVTGATSYNIYWDTQAGVTTARNGRSSARVGNLISGATSPYTHTGLTNGTTYYYIITSANGNQESAPSAEYSMAPSAGIPTAPVNVTVTATDGVMTLTWDAVTGATSYNIYWKTGGAGVTTANSQITGATSPYAHTGRSNGNTYYYIVTAVNSSGESGPSSEVSALYAPPSAPKPDAPNGITATSGNNLIVIGWNPVVNALWYNIYWSLTSPVTVVNGTKITDAVSGYNHTPLTNGTKYYYAVSTVDATGESALSTEVSATPLAAPTMNTPEPVNQQIALNWSAVSGATSYNLYWSLNTVSKANGTPIPVTGTNYTHTNLTNDTLYHYVVTAVAGTSESADSNEVTATPVNNWVRQSNKTLTDIGYSVDTDSAGNAYIAGYLSIAGAGVITNAVVMKYDVLGNLKWETQLATTANDQGLSIAVDGGGNVYVAGSTTGAFPTPNANAGGTDAFVAKLDTNGVQQWVTQFGSAGADTANGVAVDASGNVFVVGQTSGNLYGTAAGANADYFLAKFSNATGTRIGAGVQYGTINENIIAYEVSVDATGNVFFVGSIDTAGLIASNTASTCNLSGVGAAPPTFANHPTNSCGGTDFFIGNFTNTLTQTWIYQYGSLGNEEAVDIDIDTAGNLYISGHTTGSMAVTNTGLEDAFFAKISNNGQTIAWWKQLTTTSNDFAYGIGVDGSGNSYIAGETGGALAAGGSTPIDAFITKYDTNGNQQWIDQFGTMLNDYARDIAPDPVTAGKTFTVGDTFGHLQGTNPDANTDIFIKYR